MPNSKGIQRNKIEEIQNHQPKPLQNPKLNKSSNHNEVRKRRHYEKPSVKRKLKSEAARKRKKF